MLGFSGAGGARDRHIVHYAMIAQQPTMLGEARTHHTSRAESTNRGVPHIEP
jgi:hypothetical protein